MKYLALGDSYTIGESVTEAERWPMQLVEAWRIRGLNFESPKIIATTGWRTDDLKNAIDKAHLTPGFDLVSLLIGVNNQYQGKPASQYAIEFEELLQIAINLAGGKKENVFVVSIPDYGYTPFGKARQPEITLALDNFNAINREITGKAGIGYVNITDISREGLLQPELVATDGLHPSGKMYARWVARILKEINIPVTISGIAQNGKAGALIVTAGNPFYVEGVATWDSKVLHQSVIVSGTLSIETADPSELKEEGAYKSGMAGEKLILRKAAWRLQ